MRRWLVLLLLLIVAGCSAKKILLPLPPETLPQTEHAIDTTKTRIEIEVHSQTLYLFEESKLLRTYSISTARKGVGNEMGSNKTPTGLHRVYKKIGAGEPIGRVFSGREPTSLIIKPTTHVPYPREPRYMTTRILWLEGLEQSINRGNDVDTKLRYIYIHGTNLEGAIGHHDSMGCIYMKNTDVVELFDFVEEGTLVTIKQ